MFAGSPPRMRGKPGYTGRGGKTMRITPADAGKTFDSGTLTSRKTDHPRGCGENLSALFLMTACTGSPPRMRGKRTDTRRLTAHCRITPADAGKTPARCIRRQREEDHPRGCGENPAPENALERLAGSPPRMRGKLANAELVKLAVGITPADAGKTAYNA